MTITLVYEFDSDEEERTVHNIAATYASLCMQNGKSGEELRSDVSEAANMYVNMHLAMVKYNEELEAKQFTDKLNLQIKKGGLSDELGSTFTEEE